MSVSKNQYELLLMYRELYRNLNQPWKAIPHPLENYLLFGPSLPSEFPLPSVEGGGDKDIFWNYTLQSVW